MSAHLRRLLAEATPGPWERVTVGNHDQRHAAGMAFLNVMAVRSEDNPEIDFSDLTYVRSGWPNVCMTGNGPKQTDNADLIVAAVNALPVLLDVVDAARAVSEMRTKRFAEAYITTRKIGEPPPWHLIEESKRANEALDAALARLEGTS